VVVEALGVLPPVLFEERRGLPDVDVDGIFRLVTTIETIEVGVAVFGVDSGDPDLVFRGGIEVIRFRYSG
jgi:hypothetical protein